MNIILYFDEMHIMNENLRLCGITAIKKELFKNYQLEYDFYHFRIVFYTGIEMIRNSQNEILFCEI